MRDLPYSHRTLIRVHLSLLACLLFLYNVNLRQVSSYDTYASRFVPISVLLDGDLALDEFFPQLSNSQAPDGHVSDYLFRSGGRLYDSHPPIGPLLSLPLDATPVWLGVPVDDRTTANLFSKLAASLMAAVSVMVVFATMRRLLEAMVRPHLVLALVTALAYGLGTSVWSAASQAMWTHTPALLSSAVAIWALVTGLWGVAGITMGAAVLARPAMAPAAVLLVMYVIQVAWRRTQDRGRGSREARSAWRGAITCGTSGLAVGVLGLAYNLQIFGNAAGGEPYRSAYWVQTLGADHMFSGSVLTGLAGLTVSPSRGLLVFTPLAVIAFFGAIRVWRTRPAELRTRKEQEAVLLVRYVSVAVVVTILVYAKYLVWWGGHGFGPRYLTDLMPFPVCCSA